VAEPLRPAATGPATGSATAVGSVALKEWGAVVHALLQGRQTVLLRKGGIHEKAFVPPAEGGGFVLFPTTAHTHAERTRPEHRDLLPLGAADAPDGSLVVRAGVEVVGVVEVARPDRLPAIADLHIWTDASVLEDRVRFRPAKALQVLVVRAVELPDPVRLPRVEAYGGCRSWVDLPLSWDGAGRGVHDLRRLRADLARVRGAVGAD
jgi:hypothetical protein